MRERKELENELDEMKRKTKGKDESQKELIQTHRRKLADLELARNNAKNTIQYLQDENTTLKNHAESLRKEMNDHSSKLKGKREADAIKMAGMEKELDELSAIRLELQSKAKNAETRNSQMENRLVALRAENESLAAKIELMKTSDKRAVDELRRAESESTKMIANLKVEKRQLEQEIELVKISLAQNEADIRQLQCELKTAKNQLVKAESQNNDLQAECREAQTQLNELIDEHRLLQNRIQLISDENEVKQSTVAANNEQYQQAIDMMTAEKDQLQSELDRVDADFEACQVELRQSRQELEQCQLRHNQTIDQLKQEQIDLRDQINIQTNAQRTRDTNLQTVEAVNDQLKNELELAKIDLNQLKSELERVDDLLAQKDQHTDDLSNQVNLLKEELEEARNVADNVQAEFSNFHRDNGQYVVELESEKEALQLNLNELNIQSEHLTQKCSQLEVDLAEKNERLEKQSRDLVEIADENDQHVDDLARNLTEVKSEKTQLVGVVRELEDQLEEAEANLNKAYEELETKEAEAMELSDELVGEKAARTELEAKYTLLRREHEQVEEIHCQNERHQMVQREAERADLQEEVQQYKLALESAKQDVREVEHQKDELFRQLEMADRKSGKDKRNQRDLEKENEELEVKLNDLTRTLRQTQDLKLATHEESEKWRLGYEKTSGLIEAEREKNNQLKHENKELSLSETRLRTQMFQLQKMNEMLQRQNEANDTKKRKSTSKKNEPKLFTPPPMYADLERQIENLRKENAKMKAKLFGSNTDLTNIDAVTPTKPKRTMKAMDIDLAPDSQTAITSGLCYASSLPIYVGDQIVVADGAKCHQRFVDDFNRIKARAASGKKTVSAGGMLKRLVDGEWLSLEVVIKNNALLMKSSNFTDSLPLAANWAIHGSVHFEQVSYMAEVDHEFCFGLEEIDMKEMVYFCARDLIDKQTWYYNIDKHLNRPTLPMNDRTKVK